MSSALRTTLLAGLGAAGLAAWPLSLAAAATATTTFSVTANVVTTCNITATNMAFGDYSGVVLNATSALDVACSTGTPYTIALNAGTGTGATETVRKMTGPGVELLNYGLFQDAGHTINWGNTPGTDVPGVGITAVQALTVYGQIPASQFVQSGEYADTITATLAF